MSESASAPYAARSRRDGVVEAVDGHGGVVGVGRSRPCCSCSTGRRPVRRCRRRRRPARWPSCGQSDWEYRPSSNASYSCRRPRPRCPRRPVPVTSRPWRAAPAARRWDRRPGATAQAARAGAPGEERVEHALEAVRLSLRDLVEGQRGVDHAVEHHGPDVGREQRGVGEPEQRAVGLSHVGQPAVAERLAQPVHVAGDVDRPDVGQHAGAGLLARRRRTASSPAMVAACWLGVTGAGSDGGAARCPAAGDRVAALDAARVEHDDVEVVEQLRRERAELVGHVVDARDARARRGR